MIIYIKANNLILFFIIYALSNILFTEEAYKHYNINIKIEDSLGKLYINTNSINQNDEATSICEKWIPSLFFPVLLVDSDKNLGDPIERPECRVVNPVITAPKYFRVLFYYYKFFGEYNVLLSKEAFSSYVKDCYFGLSSGIVNYSTLVPIYSFDILF